MASPVELPGFTRREVTFDHRAHDVYVGGAGPAVIVMHEVPGLHPGVVAFARRLHAVGLTTYLPSLFGTPGRPASPGSTAAAIARACVAREFATWAADAASPIVAWLRQLARSAHAACGGPGVGAIGMCLTGGFALGMMIDPWVVAPVLAQPSLPFPITARHRASLGLDAATCAALAAGDVDVLGLRFTGDRLVPPERFAALRALLGERFIAVEIDSRPGNPHGIGRLAHAVLTHDLVDRPGHPTRAALDQVLAFFVERLGPPAGARR
ncbi:MAG: dienelactone hydrolase family protein [Kofleriaceae bacterium]